MSYENRLIALQNATTLDLYEDSFKAANWPVLFSAISFHEIKSTIHDMENWNTWKDNEKHGCYVFLPGTTTFQLNFETHGFYGGYAHDVWGMFHANQENPETAMGPHVPGKRAETELENRLNFMNGIGDLLSNLEKTYELILPHWEDS